MNVCSFDYITNGLLFIVPGIIEGINGLIKWRILVKPKNALLICTPIFHEHLLIAQVTFNVFCRLINIQTHNFLEQPA